MKADLNQPFDEKSLRIALAKNGVVQDSQAATLTAYPVAFARRDRSRRWHYQVGSQNQAICHLIVGLDLGDVHTRSEKFYAACPELVCRPLQFWQDADGLGYLCLEHFVGTSLDHLVEQGHCSAEQWITLTRRAQAMLEVTQRTSTASRLEQEIADLITDLLAFPGVSDLDQILFRQLIQPVLVAGRLSEPLTTRWSNGDFIGRNLLVDDGGGLRLIDYEFAGPTHFGAADWLRLLHFSVRPSAWDENTIPELDLARKPSHEIWIWLHQLAQLRNAEPSKTVDHHVADTIVRLFAAVNQAIKTTPAGKPASLLLHSLATQQSTTRSMLEERTAWAQSLEKELRQANAVTTQQNQLIEERLTWIRSLEQELQSIRAAYHDQCKLADERTTWAQSLQTELQNARTAFIDQSKLADERTEWARSLEADLQKLRAALADQTTLASERTTWAQSLQTELQNARTAFIDQSKLADERTAWALALEAERQERLNQLAEMKAFCTKRSILLPHEAASGEAIVLDRCRKAIADLQRDIEQRKADTIAASSVALGNQRRADVTETENNRLNGALAQAQLHVDHLLEQVNNLQLTANGLTHDKLATEETLRQSKHELSAAIAQLRTTRLALNRYDNNWISRLAARFSSSQPNPSSEP